MSDPKGVKATRRKSSRSNSTSSSSIVTVKRAASLSSRTGPWDPSLQGRAPSPDSTASKTPRLLPPDVFDDRTRSNSHGRGSSLTGIKEGIGNLNRWSQSTASSRASIAGQPTTTKPDQPRVGRKSFSQRLSISGSPFGSKSSSGPPTSPSRNVLTKPRPSPTRGGSISTPPISASASFSTRTIPPDNTSSSALSLDPSNAGAASTPSARSTDSYDYFAESWRPTTSESSNNTTIGLDSSTTAIQPTRDASGPRGLMHSRNLQSQSSISSVGTTQEDLATSRGGHSRNRSGGKGSAGTDGGSSTSSTNEKSRGRKHRTPSQKTMLSKALQKANTAVLLDNAQNFEGAVEAYEDACELLEQVMSKSSGDDDKKKLSTIRTTYMNRIKELKTIEPLYPTSSGKALPSRPVSDASLGSEGRYSEIYDDEEPVVIGTATATRIVNSVEEFDQRQNNTYQYTQPSLSQSSLPTIVPDGDTSAPPSPRRDLRNFSRNQFRETSTPEPSQTLEPPMSEYMPAPLSPRRGNSPNPPEPSQNLGLGNNVYHQRGHSREVSTESTSWLDTIDESGGSSGSSVHSRMSNSGLRRRTLGPPGFNGSEAEFEAALDAAVEAAYDDGYEISEEPEPDPISEVDEVILQNRRNVEIARQRVREAEMEAAYVEETRRANNEDTAIHQEQDFDYLDDEAEEEERILDEMTRGYGFDEFEFDLQTKSALPRQSDSSGFSGRTWPSSFGSNTVNTATTSLTPSTDSVHVSAAQKLPAIRAAPTATLPPPPGPPSTSFSPPSIPPVDPAVRSATPQSLQRPPSLTPNTGGGVRDRRLSGQNVKQLTIETNQRAKAAALAGKSFIELTSSSADEPKTATLLSQMTYQPPAAATAPKTNATLPPSTLEEDDDEEEAALDNMLAEADIPSPEENKPAPLSKSPPRSPHRPIEKIMTAPDLIQKTIPSVSMKPRNLSVPTPDSLDISPITPNSSGLPIMIEGRAGLSANVPVMPTPTGASFTVNGLPTGGMYLFDDHAQSPPSPSSTRSAPTSAPVPLEPCPEDFLLRPFWLMRCLYQTLTHPRGGYLSTKLFVPRDIWRVKAVKLKGVEEKTSSCDLLTAALQKLSKVDTFDADAVLEEMQSFELVLDHVRTTLSKKLGSEVGAVTQSSLFKGTSTIDENGSADALSSKTPNSSGKSYISSGWRKLRSKSSGAGLSMASTVISKDGNKDGLTLSTLPMTSSISIRPRKLASTQTQWVGPNANYMGSLARLFEAVQILDQIARQVEDPGLKYSSQTHVGLELSTRNAAEFFGFYICRFVLNDISMMLDKFIKRGTEWTLA